MSRLLASSLLVGLVVLQSMAGPDYSVITPETPYPELTAPRVFWPTMREHFLEAPFSETHFGWVRRRKIGAEADFANQAMLLASATDPTLRSRTVTLLGACLNRHAAPVLIAHLSHEQDSRVIADLLRGLGNIEGADAIADFATLLAHDEAMVRYEAAKLYAKSSKQTVTLISSRLKSEPDARVRGIFLSTLVKHAEETTAADWAATLSGANTRLKLIAIEGLLGMPTLPQEEARVLSLCNDPNPAIRLAIATHLPGSTDFADKVLEKLVGDPISGVRSQCAIFIARSPSPTRESFLQTLAVDETANPRQEAARAFATFATDSAIDRLFQLTGDPFSLVRYDAGASLSAQPDRAKIDLLAGENLAQESEDRRYHACRLLRDLGSTQHVALLRPLLESETRPKNVAAVIDALVTAGAKSHAEAMATRVVEQPPIVQRAAVRAISSFDTRSAFDNLRELVLVEGTDEGVRLDIAEAMGRLGHGEEFAATLLAILKATDPEKFISSHVRANATWSACRLDDPGTKLLKRLSAQIISKVVPIPGNPPDFDAEHVRISACWALVHLAKRDIDGASKAAKRMISILRSPLDSPTGGEMALTHRMANFAYQAQQYWDEEPVTLEDIPNYPFRFDFRKNKSRGGI